MNLSLFREKRVQYILGAVVAIVIIVVGIWASRPLWPVPDFTTYRGSVFSFMYPRVAALQEYDEKSVTVGAVVANEYRGHVEVGLFTSDPDSPLPKTFDDYAKKQATFLCGSDGSVEIVTCSNPQSEAFTSGKGFVGQKLSMQITRKNIKTGTTTTDIYAPIYVFNVTPIPESGDPPQFRAVFVYPTLSAILANAVAPAQEEKIVSTLDLGASGRRK